MLADQRGRIAFLGDDERQGPAVALAGHGNHLALAGLILRRAAIDALRFFVGLLDVAAKICAVNFDCAGEFGLVGIVYLRAHRLAQLVRDNEGRLVLHVEIPAELQRRNALDRVDEDRDGAEIVADRQLAAMKERAARHAELPAAALAAPDRAACECIDFGRAAARAVGLAAVIAPPDLDELRVRFLVTHPRNLSRGTGSLRLR